MRILVPILAAVLLGLTLTGTGLRPAPAAAQADSPAEVQIPLHPELSIDEVDPSLEATLRLFPDVERFEAARLFRTADGHHVLEVSFRDKEGRLARSRLEMDDEGLAAFRADLDDRHAAADVAPALSTEGRGSLVLRQTVLGLIYHGWAVPAALGIDSAQGGVATYLLTSGIAFYLPYHLTRTRPVTEAHRDLTLYGSSRGIAAGLVVGDLLTDGSGDERSRAMLGTGVVAGVAGSFLGYHAVERSGAEEATTALWGLMGDAGAALGFGSAYTLGLYREEGTGAPEDRLERPRSNRRLGHALGLASTAGGLWAGRWLAEREDHSVGNVSVLRSMGLLGAHLALPAANAAGASGGRAHTGAALAGGGAGMVVGNRILRPEAFTEGDGLLVGAGQIGGAAVGLGLAYLVTPDASDNELLYLSSTAAGALAGFGLVYRALSRRW